MGKIRLSPTAKVVVETAARAPAMTEYKSLLDDPRNVALLEEVMRAEDSKLISPEVGTVDRFRIFESASMTAGSPNVHAIPVRKSSTLSDLTRHRHNSEVEIRNLTDRIRRSVSRRENPKIARLRDFVSAESVPLDVRKAISSQVLCNACSGGHSSYASKAFYMILDSNNLDVALSALPLLFEYRDIIPFDDFYEQSKKTFLRQGGSEADFFLRMNPNYERV